ncbi:MAG: hypothetical protein N3J91_07285 [Verrucomicrobiae bacterium]|nr:hypothetical protein [Verrucomicrobiae bacterium]
MFKKNKKAVDTASEVCEFYRAHSKQQHRSNMRTKALLLAAAVAAGGLATAAAQTVYSINTVGYVNMVIPAGFSMIANPLNTTNNTISALMPSAPDGTTVYKYTGTGFAISVIDDTGEWSNPNLTLNPGEGCFIRSPRQFTNTFVGEVMQGRLTNSYPAGFSIRASQVPQQGTASELGFVPPEGTAIYKLRAGGSGYDIFITDDVGWVVEPTFRVGESFWLRSSTPGAWVRQFSVNP